MSDWADDEAESLKWYAPTTEIATALRAAYERGDKAGYKRGKVEAYKEAADSLLPSDGSGLAPYSIMRFIYDVFYNRAKSLEDTP